LYSPKVIEQRTKAASEKLGFQVMRHSIPSVDSACRHFKGLLDYETGQLARPLNEKEKKWIKNERALCQCDFRYWSSRYAHILDVEGKLVRFKPNIAQRQVMDIWASMEEKYQAIAVQELKARQLGVSTLTELAVAHRTQFYPNVNAVVASSDPDKSWKMSQMMERAWSNQPWYLVPRMTTYRAGVLIEFGGHNSGVTIQHGTQFSGIARGDTPTSAHLSELSDFENPEELVDASLLRAMHDSPWMFLVLESTAAGIHNWWHKKWELSKEGWPKGKSRLCPLFLPWFVGRDIYPTPTWIRTRPVPETWEPSGMTEKHAERAKAFVRTNVLLSKLLGEAWEMPREQMWYWEVSRDEYKSQGNLAKWYQEMPADDTEAFQSTNISAFDTDIIAEYREQTRVPIGVFGFVGSSVPLRVQPDAREMDLTKPKIPVVSKLSDGTIFRCELVPLKFNGYAETDFNNKLFVWEFSDEYSEYGIGVDTSDGVGQDRTVMQVLRKGDDRRNDFQCAEFASAYINSYDLPSLAYTLGCIYSPTRNKDEGVEAKMVIECNRNGEATQLELRKMGWRNFHRWERYDNRRMRLSNSNKIGWWTNAWSRSMMMDLLIKMLRDGWVDINSPWFVQEMQDLERDEVRQSMRAMGGGHDDRIMAGGIALFSMHVRELRGTQRGWVNQKIVEGPKDVDEFPLYSNFQGTREGGDHRDSIVEYYRSETE